MARIITDSAADFEHKENDILTKTQFFDLLENNESFPKTSQPIPYDFEVLLEGFMEICREFEQFISQRLTI